MKMLNKVVPVLLPLSCISPTLLADTEFEDSVPLEVVMQFIGGNPLSGTQGSLYSDILADFPAFELPNGFSVLASADQGYLQRVILRTEADTAEAQDALAAALTGAGWSLLPDPAARGQPQTGFVIGGATPPMYQQFCHDRLGNITASIMQGDAVRYAHLTRSTSPNQGNQPTCAQRLDPGYQQFGPPGFGRQNLSQYVPRLVMPTASTANNPQRVIDEMIISSGGGGGGNDFESRGTLRSGLGIDAIAEHFIDQIEQQGWEADSEVTGSVVASGSWTKTIDDMDLIGTLLIAHQGEDTWDLRFRILRQSP
jgi:hypothetical protein